MNNWKRLYIIAEGQTEEHFVNATLSVYLGESFYTDTHVRCIRTSRTQRGGLINYEQAKNDILQWAKEDDTAYITTMFDLYALPKNFPGFAEAKQYAQQPYQRVHFLENALKEDILKEGIRDDRFIPYIQLHEFEALVLSKPKELLLKYIGYEQAINQLVTLLAEKGNPELINDKPETAPSKRIEALIPAYNKIVGANVVGKIGMEWLKEHCAHFNEWVERLENIPSAT